MRFTLSLQLAICFSRCPVFIRMVSHAWQRTALKKSYSFFCHMITITAIFFYKLGVFSCFSAPMVLRRYRMSHKKSQQQFQKTSHQKNGVPCLSIFTFAAEHFTWFQRWKFQITFSIILESAGSKEASFIVLANIFRFASKWTHFSIRQKSFLQNYTAMKH